jgi:hypothetical protein
LPREIILEAGMVETVQSGSEITDRRMLRTRKMLVDSLATLLNKNSSEDISVQEMPTSPT